MEPANRPDRPFWSVSGWEGMRALTKAPRSLGMVNALPLREPGTDAPCSRSPEPPGGSANHKVENKVNRVGSIAVQTKVRRLSVETPELAMPRLNVRLTRSKLTRLGRLEQEVKPVETVRTGLLLARGKDCMDRCELDEAGVLDGPAVEFGGGLEKRPCPGQSARSRRARGGRG